jgi:glycosyltransferase involved in cell wall biosynthesis
LHAAQDAAERLALADYDALFDLWRLRPPRRVYINDLVSFDAPLDLLARLAAALQAHAPTELTLYLHDYYALCPSHCLLDADGRFCELPADPTVCNACLARHTGDFVRQAGVRDIGRWRGAWAPLVERADAIVGFAPTPLALFERVHPQARAKFQLRPHSMAHFAVAARPRIDPQGAPVLAIVGEIAQHKGAEVVLGLADAIDARAHRLRLVVIGELRHTRARLPACLTVTGRYRPDQLGRLIEQHGVNAALFPSIWPETFSYVVHELLALGLPVAAFELGAQADALARVPGGVLLPFCTGDELLLRLDRAYDAWRAPGSRLRSPE